MFGGSVLSFVGERKFRASVSINHTRFITYPTPFILQYEDHNYFYLILDLVSGGEMFEHLINYGAYSEADAARLMYEVASALAFIHGIGVVHCDLKPENCESRMSVCHAMSVVSTRQVSGCACGGPVDSQFLV